MTIPATMRALQQMSLNGPQDMRLITDAAVPRPGSGEVLVRVVAAGVNFADISKSRGTFRDGPTPPYLAGFEAAGEVAAVGAAVAEELMGTRIVGVGEGTFAEYALFPAAGMMPVPPGCAYAGPRSPGRTNDPHQFRRLAVRWERRLDIHDRKQHARHRRAVLDVEHRHDPVERIPVGTSLLALVIEIAVTSVDEVFGTHNVAVALDQLGRRLGVTSFPTDDAHHQSLWDWAGGFGTLEQAGVEGTGSFGYRLAQYLTGHGVTVFEVNRPNRTARRRRGKSDPVDAENAARAVLSGDATATPKTRTGPAGNSVPCWSPGAAPLSPAPRPSCSCAASSSNSTTKPAPASTANASKT